MATETPTPVPIDLGRIAQDLQIRRVQVESVVQLLDEGNTVPFITRYRKERTGGLDERAIREIQGRVGRLRELAERKDTILKAIEAQGKLTDELRAAIKAADNPKRLEDLYLPYKPKKRTKASEAREKGLEPLALAIWGNDESTTDLTAAAQNYLNAEKGVETPEAALEGAGHILAEQINETAAIRDAIRKLVWKLGKISATKAENLPEAKGLEYRDYFEFSEPLAHIPPHRVLAINRGDKENALKIKLEAPREELDNAVNSHLPLEGHNHAEFLRKSATDALDRLIMPSMEREVRRDLTEGAERHAVDVFAKNLRSLLLQPPIPSQVVMAIDPGFRTGCKVAVLDGHGNLVEHGVILPHPPHNRRTESKVYLKDLVGKHQVAVVAIGNGTACRETEELVAEIIAEGTHFYNYPDVPYPTVEVTPSTSEGEAHAHEGYHEESAPESEHGEMIASSEMPESSEETAHASPKGETQETSEVEPIAGGAPDAPTDAETTSEYPASDANAGGEAASDSEPQSSGEPSTNGDGAHAEAEASTDAGTSAEVAAGSEESASGAEATPAGEGEAAAAPAPAQDQGGKPSRGSEGKGARRSGDRRKPGGRSGGGHGHGGEGREPRGDRPPRTKPVNLPPAPHPADGMLSQLSYVIVNEAGASVYSASPIGHEEFPNLDATTRGTVSIGRRLQDPLSELVKIEPQNIGVGLYQHDVNPKHLKESLESVIESCVNFVGVDLNTASVPLLRHVSGLNSLTARRIVEKRGAQGPFKDRQQLLEVDGVGPATFTQAAGFLKIRSGENPLDQTWVHPESYEVAAKLLEHFGMGPDAIRDRAQTETLRDHLNQSDISVLSKTLEIGEPTLDDICASLARPERDPRDDLPKPIFKKGVLKLEDLEAGMELKGTVLNVVDFGAFVDIGLKDSGLVHISQLANRYIKSPHDVVSVGDVVTAWVLGVDQERKRVSLTMVKPGTERPRPQHKGRGGQGPDAGQGQGQGGEGGRPPRRDRGGPRPPRRDRVGAGGPGGPPPQGPGRQGAPQGQGQAAPAPAAPKVNARIPGPPSRMMSGGGGRGGPRPGGGGGRGGPGGPRPGGPSQGGNQSRIERASANRPPVKPPKPIKPLSPPKPLSKEALSGNAPLRSFGQLKQLWTNREEGPETGAPGDESLPTSPATTAHDTPDSSAAPESPSPAGEGSGTESAPE